jgi:hypothetical protein
MGTGYLGISKVDINIATHGLDVVVAGDQGQRPGDRDVDELVEGHFTRLGPNGLKIQK